MKLKLLAALLLMPFFSYSQVSPFALMDYTDATVDVAKIGLNRESTAQLLFRTQRSLPGIKNQSSVVSIAHPFLVNKASHSSLGIVLAHHTLGENGLYASNAALVNYTRSFPISKLSNLAIGTAIEYNQQVIDTKGLSTGSQFIDGFGFDQNLPNGETGFGYERNHISVGLGIHWQEKFKNKEARRHFGITAKNLNQPASGLIKRDNNNTPSLAVFAGHHILTYKNTSTYLEGTWQSANKVNLINAGLLIKVDLATYHPDLRGQNLVFHTKVKNNVGPSIGVEWENEMFTLATNVELPIHKTPANKVAFEIALKIKRPVREKYKVKKRKSKKRIVRKPNVAEVISDDTVITPNDSTAHVIEEKRKSESNFDRLKLLNKQELAVQETAQPLQSNFYFDFASSSPIITNNEELQALIDEVVGKSTHRLVITGHTDNVGNNDYNQQLSEDRAQAIYEALIQMGLDPDRMSHRGVGESQPLLENNTEANRAINRRVEIRIVKE